MVKILDNLYEIAYGYGSINTQGQTMIKAELIEALSNEAGLTRSKAKDVVKTVFNSMAKALAKGDRVEIRGLGSFKVKHYDGYAGRNPKTGKPIKVKAKKMPVFKCGKELKERVDTYK